MSVNTIVLLVEVLVIVGLSSYVWFGSQNPEEVSTLQWIGLFVLILFLIGFTVTLFFNPLTLK